MRAQLIHGWPDSLLVLSDGNVLNDRLHMLPALGGRGHAETWLREQGYTLASDWKREPGWGYITAELRQETKQ